MAVSRIDEAGLNVTQYGNRNLMINGDMQIAQRGTSASVTTAGSSYDSVDRFESYRNSSYAPNFTSSRDSTGPVGFSRSLKIDVDATATPTTGQNFGIRTKIEGFDAAQTGLGTSGSKQITLSFYVKSNKTGTYGTQIFRNGSTVYSTTKGYTIDAADTWERKEITYTALTTNNTPEVANSWGIMIHFELSSGPDDIVAPFDWTAQGAARTVTGQVNLMDSTSNYWQITGVQLEVGDTATAFEHRNYGDELARCQRYYQRFAGSNAGIMNHHNRTTTARYGVLHHPVEFRTTPTLGYSSLSHFISYVAGTSATPTAITRQGETGISTEIYITTASNGSAGQAGWLRVGTASGAYLDFDAEL